MTKDWQTMDRRANVEVASKWKYLYLLYLPNFESKQIYPMDHVLNTATIVLFKHPVNEY
jgi:hypothetical protein